MFGHEGDNSILGFLKEKGLATYIQVSKKSMVKQMTKFEVTVELTAKGLK